MSPHSFPSPALPRRAAAPQQGGYSQQERRHLSNEQKPTHAFILLHALPSLGKSLRQAKLPQDI